MIHVCMCVSVCVLSWLVCGTAAIHQCSPLILWQLDRSHLPFDYYAHFTNAFAYFFEIMFVFNQCTGILLGTCLSYCFRVTVSAVSSLVGPAPD